MALKQGGEKPDELLRSVLTIVGIAVAVILLIVLFKLKGGVLGVIIGTIAAVALIFWLVEAKRIFEGYKAQSSEEYEWFYDLIEEDEKITFAAKVPGPAEEVKVKIVGGMLEVKGGGNFLKRIRVPRGLTLEDEKYVNGILQVKLRKTKTLHQKNA